ncbi:MAG: peptidoglycan DD-metalloendopeptidase family protein, partial [Actinobacteria bacterium]|nr:peptidoglycan DD-metalloendopeptidase family protein [Actinomycetota bacterium]
MWLSLCSVTPARPRFVVSTLAAIGALVMVLSIGVPINSPAFADEYPTWEEVQDARRDVAKAEAKVKQIMALLEKLEKEAAEAEMEAARLGEVYYEALAELDEATFRQQQLQSEADSAQILAEESRLQAGQFVAELARVGGADLSATLFISGDNATELLSRIGYAAKIAEQTDGIYARALADQNAAQSLSDQAEVARQIREELQVIAEAAYEAANAAAMRAYAAVEAQLENSARLEAQLEVLIEKREATEADYQKGEIERAKAQQGGTVAGMIDPGQISGAGWARPSGGYVSSHFGMRVHPIYGVARLHAGIDLATACGRPVYAARGGRVSYSGWLGTSGNFIRVTHEDGVTTGYAHLQNGSLYVRSGQTVATGQLIGRIGNTGGSTGCHLHLETRQNMVAQDPYPFFLNRGIRLG